MVRKRVFPHPARHLAPHQGQGAVKLSPERSRLLIAFLGHRTQPVGRDRFEIGKHLVRAVAEIARIAPDAPRYKGTLGLEYKAAAHRAAAVTGGLALIEIGGLDS